MIYTKLTNKALKFAYDAHHGQLDINGVPYVFHAFSVAEQMTDEITTCVALLHDVVEDTAVTIEEIAENFPPEVVEALKLLTHNENTDYFEYVKKIRTNPVAKAVKLADLAHNSDRSRIADLSRVSQEKLDYWDYKYSRAIKILTE